MNRMKRKGKFLTFLPLILTVGCLTLFAVSGLGLARATTVASPPNSTELIGVWFGFSEADAEFVRVELKSDMTGICAVVASPTVLSRQAEDVGVYVINRWRLDGWKLEIDLSPEDAKAEPMRLSGTFDGSGLHAQMSGIKSKWKRALLLQKESSFDEANRAAIEAIKIRQKQ